ncbi:putative late blight resistance protein homolog R1B-17 [Coffea arabica]|uniref:Late blight resistance protein homolog R1B-17 n=1 Tax=Coffea arabica TaxID=13443 RepID=A0A6P6TD07_COFAR|nr:putative late blight resistance protein homolog R1B-17 [Coffea arabica]
MDFGQLVSKLSKLQKHKWFFDMDVEKLRMRLIHQYWLELPFLDDEDYSTYFIVKGFSDYLKLRQRLDQDMSHLTEDLLLKLKLSRALFFFAAMQGVDKMQLIDLLAHYTFLAVNAECLRKVYWSVCFKGEVFKDIQLEICHLQCKIKLVDFQFHVTSVRVLKALLKASKVLSRSPLTFAPEKNKYIAEEFVDSLLGAFRQILECHAMFTVSMHDQMQKLHEGVKFLSILLHVKQEKFYALSDGMKDRIGDMIIDAGIVICSLSVSKTKYSLAKETDLALLHLLKDLQFVMEEVAQTYPPTSSSLSFPRTNELGSIDFFLENLKELATSDTGSIAFPKDQIQRVQEDLIFLRSFLWKIVKLRSQNGKLQALWDRAMEVAYKTELIIDSVVLGDKLECLDTVAGDIKHVKTEALKLSDSIRSDNEAQRVTKKSIHLESQLSTPALDEVLVGLDEEVKTITNRLTKGLKKRDIVSIVGMAGLGKTTLANTVYHHPSILNHFHIRACCTVSQVYSRHNLLVQILCSVVYSFADHSVKVSPDKYLRMDEDDLAAELKKVLSRNMYLIVLDDVWDIEAWNLLKDSLPDDSNGSRILFTSRFQNLSLQFKPDSKPYHLRQLTGEECFALLQRKIFGKKNCPSTLTKVLIQIASKCKGLPHTIVIFAGILSRIEQYCWQEFADSLSSSTPVKTEPLELSYSHLPEYLKPCLLYFGAFREDQDIPVRRLLWLWISEGFVQKTEGKSLDDMAEDYLMDLVSRSLVTVTKQRTTGGAKTCQIHDLVHEFCLAKAKHESFLQILHGDSDISTFTGPCPHRLCIYLIKEEELEKMRLYFPNLRCLFVFSYYHWNFSWKVIKLRDGSPGFPVLKLLRVLDLGDFDFGTSFPMEVVFLAHLRFLAIHGHMKDIPSAIDNLSRLETFLVEGNFDA